MWNDKKYEFGKVCSRRRMLFCCKKNAQSSQMAMYNFHIAWVCVSSCICRTTHTDAYNHYVMQLQLPILFCLCNVFIVVFFVFVSAFFHGSCCCLCLFLYLLFVGFSRMCCLFALWVNCWIFLFFELVKMAVICVFKWNNKIEVFGLRF